MKTFYVLHTRPVMCCLEWSDLIGSTRSGNDWPGCLILWFTKQNWHSERSLPAPLEIYSLGRISTALRFISSKNIRIIRRRIWLGSSDRPKTGKSSLVIVCEPSSRVSSRLGRVFHRKFHVFALGYFYPSSRIGITCCIDYIEHGQNNLIIVVGHYYTNMDFLRFLYQIHSCHG